LAKKLITVADEKDIKRSGPGAREDVTYSNDFTFQPISDFYIED
jgi:hypothetical protein